LKVRLPSCVVTHSPFNDVLVSKNAFYLVCHDSQAELGKIAAFRQWILAKAASEQEKFRFRYEQ
jgi:LysR family glycine cleavage system transcriptional activator